MGQARCGHGPLRCARCARSHTRSDRYLPPLHPCREQTLRWAMVDQLRAPPPYFADVIQGHFRLRGDAVLATARHWSSWCREKGHTSEFGAAATTVHAGCL